MQSRHWHWVFITSIGVIVGLLGALVFAYAGGPLSPPRPVNCEQEHPTESRCVVNDNEVCHSFVRGGVADNTVTCSAFSSDGHALLRLLLEGSGRVTVRVTDAAGVVQYAESHTLPHDEDITLDGKSGAWRLSVAHENVRGSPVAQLWG